MGNAAWLEGRLALAGSLRLARGEPTGLSYFDRSLDGFWRSFRAAVICYPLYLLLLSMRVSVGDWQRSGGGRGQLQHADGHGTVSYTHLTLPTTPYV